MKTLFRKEFLNKTFFRGGFVFVALFFVSFSVRAQETALSIDAALDEIEENLSLRQSAPPAPKEKAGSQETAVKSVRPKRKLSLETDSLPHQSVAREAENPGAYDDMDPQGIMQNITIDLLRLKDMDIKDVLNLLSEKSQLNIIAGKNIQGKVSIFLKDVQLKDALRIILDSNNLAYKVENGIIRVMPAQEFEERYGLKFGRRTLTRIVPLSHVKVKDVMPLLEKVKSSSGQILSDLKSNTLVLMDTEERLNVMEKLVREIDIPSRTVVFKLNYAKAKDMADNIQEFLTENIGQAKADERSNKLIVTDTISAMDRIEQIVQAFDVKQQQVLIEAKIVQVVLSNEHQFGIDWEAIVSEYHDLDLNTDFDVLSSTDKRGQVSIGTLTSDDYTVLLQALETVGKSNILSSPSITAVNNQEAKILVGSTEPYVTTTTTTTASGPTTTAESVNFIEVGVKLYVTPEIHKDGFVTMKIRPEVSSVISTVSTSQNNSIPVVDTSEAETTVMVKDGVTIVIGGLIKDEEIFSSKKVPLLGDTPLLGHLFRNEDKLKRKTEIVIFLTPRIISGDVPEERIF